MKKLAKPGTSTSITSPHLTTDKNHQAKYLAYNLRT
jgi:hypothetical protein